MSNETIINIRVVCSDAAGVGGTNITEIEAPFALVIYPVPLSDDEIDPEKFGEINVVGLCNPENAMYMGAAVLSFLEDQDLLVPTLLVHKRNKQAAAERAKRKESDE